MGYKMKVKYVAVGKCASCGKEFVRPAVCTHAACDCSSVIEVPLHRALILPCRLHKKIKRIADLAEVSVEDFVNKMIEVAAKEKVKEMKVSEKGLFSGKG